MIDSYKVPMYVKETTEDRLIAAMLKNNIRLGAMMRYTDIRKNGKYWYAWYLGDGGYLVKNRLDGVTTNGDEKNNTRS